MGYSLRVNHKKLAGASNPNRDQQFRHITDLRGRCAADNSPLISVDTKKKELVGTFRNPGAKWDRSPELVNDHDFRSDARRPVVGPPSPPTRTVETRRRESSLDMSPV